MKKNFSILFLTLISFMNLSAATPEIIDKYVKVNQFNEIVLKGSTKVIFNQGDSAIVRIHGLKEGAENVIVEQSGDELIISQKSTNVNSFGDLFRALKKQTIDETLIVYITTPNLSAIKLQGSGDFKMKGQLEADNLNIRLIGSGDIDLEKIFCKNLITVLEGSGDIDINFVECETSKVTVDGSGDIEIKQHKVNKTDIYLTGSGDIEVACSNCNEVNANIKGSGDIKLSGNIKTLNKSVRGSGEIFVK